MIRSNRSIFGFSLLLLTCCSGLLLSGCDYEHYRIVVGNYMVEGIAISDWRDVRSTGSSLRISPGGRLAIRSEEQTQFLAQFDISILSGSGVNFYVKTVAHEFDPSHGIAFHYAIDGCWVRREDGKMIPLELNAETGDQTLKFLVEADEVEISVGCDRIYQGLSGLAATEYIIIETLPDTELEIKGVNYFNIEELVGLRISDRE